MTVREGSRKMAVRGGDIEWHRGRGRKIARGLGEQRGGWGRKRVRESERGEGGGEGE